MSQTTGIFTMERGIYTSFRWLEKGERVRRKGQPYIPTRLSLKKHNGRHFRVATSDTEMVLVSPMNGSFTAEIPAMYLKKKS